MRKLGLSIVSISLAALAFSCGSDGDEPAGTGGVANPAAGGTLNPNAGGSIGAGGSTSGGSTSGGSANPSSGGADPSSGGADPSSGGADPSSGGANPSSGGNDNGSTGGTGGIVDRPPLVVSGEGAFWQVKTEADLTPGTTATVTVDTTTKHQKWHGFGGTFNEKGWVALQALSDADRAEVFKLLFDAKDGIGLDWGRIPIGPSDYANERYTLSTGPGDFDITHDQSTLIPYIKEAQKVKSDIKFWASPWSPPPWAKTGTTENDGYDKGYFDTTHYQAYADYFIDWIQAYEAENILIDHVMPENEPGWAQSYPTAAFGPARDTVANANVYTTGADSTTLDPAFPVTLGTFVDGYLFPSIDAAGLTTDVWFGTLSNNDFFGAYWDDMKSKASASRIIGVGLQWATQPNVGSIAADGYLVMQSEHKCGNYPWVGDAASKEAADYDTFWAAEAPNNYNYGVESWGLMRDWINDGVHIYSAWNMVLDTGGFNLDMVRPWPQNAMFAVDLTSGALQKTAYYYVFRHIAQYADVGATRVEVTGNALAFQNPDGSVMTAIFNEGAAPASTTLSVDGNMVTFEIPAEGWATVNTKAP